MLPTINPSIPFHNLILVHQLKTLTTKASITINADMVMGVDASNNSAAVETIGSNNVASIMATNINRIMATNINNIMATNTNQNTTAGPMVCAATTAQLAKRPYQDTNTMQPWINAWAVTIVAYDGVGASV